MAAMPEQLIKRTIRRGELRQIVPLANSTIYEMEQRGEFPRRFALTTRCVVWDRAPHPDVRKRRSRPVKAPGQEPASTSTAE